jgi:hypothetical protein
VCFNNVDFCPFGQTVYAVGHHAVAHGKPGADHHRLAVLKPGFHQMLADVVVTV